METINLFGAGGHAKVIMDIIAAQGDRVERLYDDVPRLSHIHDRKVVNASELETSDRLIIAIGNNKVRKQISERLNNEFATALHPTATISPSASIGEGSVVMPGAIVQADAEIGRHCIVNTGATVDHECSLGDYVHIAPGVSLCGNVSVGEGTLIGVGAKVIPGISIGRWCTIGAGSVVITDIPDGTTAYGNPCKIR